MAVITNYILSSAIVAIVGWVAFEIQIQTASCDQRLLPNSSPAVSAFTPVRVLSIVPAPEIIYLSSFSRRFLEAIDSDLGTRRHRWQYT